MSTMKGDSLMTQCVTDEQALELRTLAERVMAAKKREDDAEQKLKRLLPQNGQPLKCTKAYQNYPDGTYYRSYQHCGFMVAEFAGTNADWATGEVDGAMMEYDDASREATSAQFAMNRFMRGLKIHRIKIAGCFWEVTDCLVRCVGDDTLDLDNEDGHQH
jgi:hypothetical protein